MLNLCGKTYTIGEDMQLSIDADALSAEKADALQMVDKAIANCLYKLGEVPADFDEADFLADFDTYKASKSDVLENTIDYLKELLETRPNLV
jgi:isopentenyldiphosphate isomerase